MDVSKPIKFLRLREKLHGVIPYLRTAFTSIPEEEDSWNLEGKIVKGEKRESELGSDFNALVRDCLSDNPKGIISSLFEEGYIVKLQERCIQYDTQKELQELHDKIAVHIFRYIENVVADRRNIPQPLTFLHEKVFSIAGIATVEEKSVSFSLQRAVLSRVKVELKEAAKREYEHLSGLSPEKEHVHLNGGSLQNAVKAFFDLLDIQIFKKLNLAEYVKELGEAKNIPEPIALTA